MHGKLILTTELLCTIFVTLGMEKTNLLNWSENCNQLKSEKKYNFSEIWLCQIATITREKKTLKEQGESRRWYQNTLKHIFFLQLFDKQWKFEECAIKNKKRNLVFPLYQNYLLLNLQSAFKNVNMQCKWRRHAFSN